MLSSYKGSPYSVLLSCQGSSPLARWKLQPTTGRSVSDQLSHHLQRVYERDIKGYCIHLLSQSIKLEYDLETGVIHSSGSHHPFLVIQLYVPAESKKLTIEITTSDTLGSKKNTTKRHLFFSTANKELKTTPLHAAIPISSIVQRGEWFSLILDLPMYYSQLYPTATYKSMEKVAFMGDRIRFRNIFTMKTFQNEEGVPSHLDFPFHSFNTTATSSSSSLVTKKGTEEHQTYYDHHHHHHPQQQEQYHNPKEPSRSSSSLSSSSTSSIQMQKMKILERVNLVSQSVDACDEEVHQIVSSFKEKQQQQQQQQQQSYLPSTSLVPLPTIDVKPTSTLNTPHTLLPTSHSSNLKSKKIKQPSSSSSSSSSSTTASPPTPFSSSSTSTHLNRSSRSSSSVSITSTCTNAPNGNSIQGLGKMKKKDEVPTWTPPSLRTTTEQYHLQQQQQQHYTEDVNEKKNTDQIKSVHPTGSSFIFSSETFLDSSDTTNKIHYDDCSIGNEHEKEEQDVEEENQRLKSISTSPSPSLSFSLNVKEYPETRATKENLNVGQVQTGKSQFQQVSLLDSKSFHSSTPVFAEQASEDNNNKEEQEQKEVENHDDDDDDSVELIYSEVHQCYYDPVTGKFYEIV